MARWGCFNLFEPGFNHITGTFSGTTIAISSLTSSSGSTSSFDLSSDYKIILIKLPVFPQSTCFFNQFSNQLFNQFFNCFFNMSTPPSNRDDVSQLSDVSVLQIIESNQWKCNLLIKILLLQVEFWFRVYEEGQRVSGWRWWKLWWFLLRWRLWRIACRLWLQPFLSSDLQGDSSVASFSNWTNLHQDHT